MTDFRLLGPVEICVGGRPLAPTAAKQQTVLVALLIDAPTPVSVDDLIDRVWDEDPPAEARNVLYAHISRIRRLLAGAGGRIAVLTRRSGGYGLEVDADRVDLHRARRLIRQARADDVDDERRADLLAEAVGLWRGEPLTGLRGAWIARTRERLHRLRLETYLDWAHCRMRLGHPAEVVEVLQPLLADHPLDESLAALLMRALHAAGHTAYALDCYARTRTQLAEQLGIDPGNELRELHRAILRRDLDRPPPRPVPAPAASPVPAQLPADVQAFTGRHHQLTYLDTLLASAEQPTAVIITALSGTAGVGKTALAVHWAHLVRDRFPDGQLYVNLRGFDPTGSVLAPTEVVRRFLEALHVPAQRIPADLDAQAALYRTLLTGRRMLVVLDNARDADQVRPLLPGAPGCLVLITSRNRLTSLVAAESAHPLALDLLTAAEARDLLTRRLGGTRVAAEPDAVDELITRCARLPLALTIVAAHAATHPERPLAVLTGQLGQGHDPLDALSTGDAPRTDLRTVFSWSYQALGADAARLLRLIGLHPGPDISAAAAASLAAVPADRVRPLLAELRDAHLLNEHTPGRYSCHDLLRAYATRLAHDTDSDRRRRTATCRLLDHYLHTAHAAIRSIDPPQEPIDLARASRGVTPQTFTDQSQALAWLTAEHQALVTLVDSAASTGFDTHAWQLSWALFEYFQRRGHWRDWVATSHTALKAAQRLGHLEAQTRARHGLAHASGRLGRFDEAAEHYLDALDGYGRLGHHAGQARTHRGLAWLHEQQGRYGEALQHCRQALQLHRAAGNRSGQAGALNATGWYHAQLGEYRQTITYCQQALSLLRDLDDQQCEAATWDSLGYAHHHLDDHSRAADCYRRALQLYRHAGDRYNEADVLTHLGDTHHTTGDHQAARHAWQQALTILHELDHPDAQHVHAKLSGHR